MSDDTDTRGPRERAYDDHVSQLMKQIIAICREHSIPMLATFELDSDSDGDDGHMHCTTSLINDSDLKPGDDRLIRALRIIRQPPPAWAAWAAFIIASEEMSDE